eukprot:CAMPEP_0113580272 /NCGR_PEP_ID=MMETSP0015_2-20120614/30577_1 /TAXON_ID=2838 /ORGANISM="Odontella" /LENGTH=58 /DNA_ID=CAMNT_0000484435 /DNA_START=1123 /DNA_END=1294 /DNA_ORIENTATION=- /assembly_acc=CAM_ASM_000160
MAPLPPSSSAAASAAHGHHHHHHPARYRHGHDHGGVLPERTITPDIGDPAAAAAADEA